MSRYAAIGRSHGRTLSSERPARDKFPSCLPKVFVDPNKARPGPWGQRLGRSHPVGRRSPCRVLTTAPPLARRGGSRRHLVLSTMGGKRIPVKAVPGVAIVLGMQPMDGGVVSHAELNSACALSSFHASGHRRRCRVPRGHTQTTGAESRDSTTRWHPIPSAGFRPNFASHPARMAPPSNPQLGPIRAVRPRPSDASPQVAVRGKCQARNYFPAARRDEAMTKLNPVVRARTDGWSPLGSTKLRSTGTNTPL